MKVNLSEPLPDDDVDTVPAEVDGVAVRTGVVGDIFPLLGP